MEIKNGKIESVKLYREVHGILTFSIMIQAYRCGFDYGGYALDEPGENYERVYSASGLEAIARIMDTVEVNAWEDLPGKYIRWIDDGLGKPVDIIGHIIDDKWFNIREFFANKHKEDEQ